MVDLMRIIFFIFIFTSLIFSQKIEVTANFVEANSGSKQVKFVGNVNIWQDSSNWMKANEAIVYFDDANQTKQYEAIGNASFEMKDKNGHYKGKANGFKHFVKESIYIMQGNAQVSDLLNKRFLSGDMININMKTGIASVKSQTKKPVKFIFELKKK